MIHIPCTKTWSIETIYLRLVQELLITGYLRLSHASWEIWQSLVAIEYDTYIWECTFLHELNDLQQEISLKTALYANLRSQTNFYNYHNPKSVRLWIQKRYVPWAPMNMIHVTFHLYIIMILWFSCNFQAKNKKLNSSITVTCTALPKQCWRLRICIALQWITMLKAYSPLVCIFV